MRPPRRAITTGSHMPDLFNDSMFAAGGWAPGLQKLLVRPQILPGWKPKARLWRGTWTQWVQFEPNGNLGSLFWSAKPAVLPLRASQADGVAPPEYLAVGCYVERGLPAHVVAGPMHAGWHWHGFMRALSEDEYRGRLVELMLALPEERRSVWISTSDGASTPVGARRLPFTGSDTLEQAKEIIDAAPVTAWIDVVVGCSFAKEECLARQGDLVPEFRNSTVRARETVELISDAMPPRP